MLPGARPFPARTREAPAPPAIVGSEGVQAQSVAQRDRRAGGLRTVVAGFFTRDECFVIAGAAKPAAALAVAEA